MASLGWLLCLVAVSSCCFLQGAVGYYQVTDCCLRTKDQPIPFKILSRYREQHIQEGCLIRAVVFITVRGRQLCAPHHAPWVKKLKERLDHKWKRSSRTYP